MCTPVDTGAADLGVMGVPLSASYQTAPGGSVTPTSVTPGCGMAGRFAGRLQCAF